MLFAALALALATLPGAAQDGAPDWPGVAPFDIPALETERRAALRAAASGDPEGALRLLERPLSRAPDAPPLLATRAVAEMVAGRPDAALDNLEAAARGGLAELQMLAQAPVFAPLRAEPRFAAMLSDAAPAPVSQAEAAPIGSDQTALVAPANTRWRGDLGALESLFAFPDALARQPVRGPDMGDDAARQLRRLQARGLAAGNAGDLYDNRDGDHSGLRRADYPQLGFVEYGPEAQVAKLHYGANFFMRFNAPTFGNSSTAATAGPLWRGQPRLMLTHPDGPATLAAQYAANYVPLYPAHKDFGAGNGDLIPASTPYMIVSQGSSGSDRPFMRAVADILAAFRPETKAFLTERGLIAPTVQMILRRSRDAIRSDEAYMSAAAHPAAFPREGLSRPRAIALANALTPQEIPPPARITLVEENVSQGRLSQSGGAPDRPLFDTPSAVARIARAPGGTRRYVLSAAATEDPNGRPLRFDWRVFGAGAEAAQLTPLNAEESAVELVVEWPDASEGGRLDVAIFAHNGAHPSAPAFFSLAFAPNENRVYDSEGRILSIDYAAQAESYADPLLFPRRLWRDAFDYAPDGDLLGWTRTGPNGTQRFTRHGLRALEFDALGRVTLAEEIRIVTMEGVLREQSTGTRFVYVHEGPDDLFGSLERIDASSR